jgi:hypothetical protein
MTTQRVKCSDCDNMILPDTAMRYDGSCKPCSQLSQEARRELREHDRLLKAGLLFVPSEEELATARRFDELEPLNEMWRPAFGEEEEGEEGEAEPESVHQLLEESLTCEKGLVSLSNEGGRRLLLSFNREFGVCEYQDQDGDGSFYAYTQQNLEVQVPPDLHLAQSCSDCDVDVFWYPSRFHMRREHAFAVIARILDATGEDVPARLSREHPPVRWLKVGDISRVDGGRG